MSDFIFDGIGNCQSICDLEIVFADNDDVILIATEKTDNPGTSVTNALEDLIYQVVERYNFDMEKIIWIEHYPPNYTSAGDNESFDLVQFVVDEDDKIQSQSIRWKRITEDQVEDIRDGANPLDFDIHSSQRELY